MTQDEIIRMAREAGLVTETHGRDWIDAGFPDDCLFDFAALVAANEREAILEIVKTIGGEFSVDCAVAIRARGENGTA